MQEKNRNCRKGLEKGISRDEKYLQEKKITIMIRLYFLRKGEIRMKSFYGGTFLRKEELEKEGIDYPIKLEYYKIIEMNHNKEEYGVEIVKTEYRKEETKIESEEAKKITKDEKLIEDFLELLRRNDVMPVTLVDIMEDMRWEKRRKEQIRKVV